MQDEEEKEPCASTSLVEDIPLTDERDKELNYNRYLFKFIASGS